MKLPTIVAESPRNPEKFPLWQGCAPLGDGRFQPADDSIAVSLYRPEHPNGAALIICPGGGYGDLVAQEGELVGRWLNRHGITAIVLDYRIPEGRSFVPLSDAQRAIRMARFNAKEWSIDPSRIGIIGFSAGGHLASSAGTHFVEENPQAPELIDRISCRPDFMLLIYPVITMGVGTDARTKKNLIGTEPTADLVELFSNEKQVTERTPPTFLAHALDDKIVVPNNSVMFHEALLSHRVPSMYVELPHGGHGLNGYKGPMWETWKAESLKWMARQNVIPAADACSPAC